MTLCADGGATGFLSEVAALNVISCLQDAFLPIGVIIKLEVDVAGHFIGVPSVAEKSR